MEPARGPHLPAAAEQRVIDRDRDRLPGRDQQRHNTARRLPGLLRGAGLGQVGSWAVCPANIDGTRDNHTLLVTFARPHGAELVADGACAGVSS